MRSLFSQFAGLIGILAFVNLLLTQAPIERALLTGIGTGLAVYVVLSLGDIVIHRILEQAATHLSHIDPIGQESASPENAGTAPPTGPAVETPSATRGASAKPGDKTGTLAA